MDEIQQLRVRLMELERGALIGARHPGDGVSEESKSGYVSEMGFTHQAGGTGMRHGEN